MLTASDSFLSLAIWAELSIVAAVVACCMAIIVMRINTLRQQRRIARQKPYWREALAVGIHGEMPSLHVARQDRWHFMKLWCQSHDSVRGEAREALKNLARSLGMQKWAIDFASKHRLRDRLLGIIALGCIGESKGIERLKALVNEPNSVLSLTAAEAYARIVPTEALPIVLHAASRREDWPMARLMEILAEAGPTMAKDPLLAAVRTNRGRHRQRLVPLLACLESRDTMTMVRKMLSNQDDPEILAAALPLAHPEDLPYVRAAANHSAWFVRAKACRVLGEYGDATDTKLLQHLLGDREWWVRYRAAESLLKIPGISRAHVRQLATSHPDPFARDMLKMWLDSPGDRE